MYLFQNPDIITRVYGQKKFSIPFTIAAGLTKIIRIITLPLAQGSHNKQIVPVSPFVHTSVLLEEKMSGYILWKRFCII